MKPLRKYFSLFSLVSIIIFSASFATLKICMNNPTLADRISSGVGAYLRSAMASISNRAPFSIFEILVCLIPVLVIALAAAAVRVFRRGKRRVRFLTSLLGAVLLVYAFYIFTMGISYHTTRLSEKIGLNEVEVTGDNLYKTAMTVIEELNALADEIKFEDGESCMGYSMDELSARLADAYSLAGVKYPVFSGVEGRAKPIRMSNVMSMLRILGIYTFFTGEANVNIAYPDFDRPYTAAHEFAHQRGILRENEANFLAFLVCIESHDPFIRYSGYLRLYEYLISALYNTDRELWKSVVGELDPRCVSDIKASNAVTEKYGDSFIGDISNAINDFYLKQNGTDGVVTYGLVTRLAVAYYSQTE